MRNLQLLSKKPMNRWRLAMGNRVSEDGISFHELPLAEEFARQGITYFRWVLTPSRSPVNDREISAKLRINFCRRAARRLVPDKFALVETSGFP